MNASPIFIVTFFILTYLLNRPCVYCSILLVILFSSSCYWSDQCFFDLNSNWFEPRRLIPESSVSITEASAAACTGKECISETKFLFNAINETARSLIGAAAEEAKRAMLGSDISPDTEWAKSWLGSWRIPCLDVNIRL